MKCLTWFQGLLFGMDSVSRRVPARERRATVCRLRRRLHFPEPLEPRRLLATFVVNQTSDLADFDLNDAVPDVDPIMPGQQTSLRSAIQTANSDTAPDNIFFNIPGEGVQVISPNVPLPTITQPVVIDGYMQPMAKPNMMVVGSDAKILIQLDGFSAGAASGLTISAGSIVRGLSITRFNLHGVEILAGTSTIAGNHIGVSPAGTADLGNLQNGLLIVNSVGNMIGGVSPGDRNVISGNSVNGVGLAGTAATGNIIQGNYIGTNAAGDADLGNGNEGVSISELTTGGGSASHTMIGGPFPGSGNLISGNDGGGVALNGAGAQFNVVQGNRIGTNAMGTAAIGNGFHGVLVTFIDDLAASNNTIGGVPDPVSAPMPRNIISGNERAGVAIYGAGATGNKVQGNYLGTDITGTAAIPNGNDGVRIGDNSLGAGPSNNLIGGTEPGAGNLISGNMDNGIEIAGGTTNANRIEGNLIGTIVGGSGPRPNQRMGVLVDGATGTVIGGTTPDARNVVSGNGNSGVCLSGDTATSNRIEGNYIGVTADAVAGLANQGSGVLIRMNASGNVVGGSTIDSGNLIAYNVGDGVTIGSGVRNMVRLNSIRNNNGLGIDLNLDGETLNDRDDADTGPNDFQNWPEIVNFTIDGLFSKVTGFFEGKDNTTYTLDFYSNDGAVFSNLGEGQEYLSTETLTTDANGYVKFTYIVPLVLPLGKFLTVTATDPDGNTSEFSHDADTDGLYDHWESSTVVDGNNDGVGDFFLNNPDPLHKDIYVEVDAMGVINPAAAGIDVVNAFATKASALNVLNPDGQAGIMLHFELDAGNIFQQPITNMGELRAVKNVEFGTSADFMGDPATVAARLAAKRMTHRYAAFGPSGGPNGGASWLYSHEFYVAQGPAHQEKLATAFMHELGHALNIHHGGGDGVNYKPNYHSILNYLWTYRSQNMDGFRTSWELNYSERAFNTLDENNLVEAAGIGGHPGHTTKVGPLPGQLMNEFGPVDWNGDGDMTDVITTGININGLAAPGPDDPEQIGATILFGHNDWANLFLNFRHSFKYREEFGLETGASEVAAGEHHHSHGGPTPEIVAQLDDIGYTNRAVRIHGLPDVYANEGDRIAFTVPTTDPEGDALTFALVPGAPSDASIHPMTGQFTWPTDAADGYGEYIITIQVTDSGSGRMREHNFGFIVDVGLTGDYNLNGVVDAADYVVWRNTLGTTGPLYAGADSSGNGIVDQADYLIWRANFGKTLPLPASGSSATAATDATESKVPTPPLFTRAENHAIHLSALAAGKFVQTDSQIIKSQQPRRNIQTVALSHDKALIGWLTSDAQATRREYPADNFKDQPGEMKGDASPKVLADAFDSVFAQHGFFT